MPTLGRPVWDARRHDHVVGRETGVLSAPLPRARRAAGADRLHRVGSVALRSNRCGKDNCACHGDPPRLHGPYWHFTAKVAGKTVNKRLSESEARLYEEWIANDRKARDLLAEMRALAAQAAPLILAQEPSTAGEIDGRNPKRRSPESARRPSRSRS